MSCKVKCGSAMTTRGSYFYVQSDNDMGPGMEKITGLFLVLWLTPLVVNSYLLKDEGLFTNFLVLLLTALFSWAVTTIIACWKFMESPVFGIGGDRLDLQLHSMDQPRDYVFFSDAGSFPMVIELPGDGVGSRGGALGNRL